MRLIYFEDLEPMKGIKLKEMSLWRMMQAGEFPQCVIVGKQRKAWREHEVDAWIANLPTGKGREPTPSAKKVEARAAAKAAQDGY
jgi:predicted DNA-binding transcriptional regulator AlpA